VNDLYRLSNKDDQIPGRTPQTRLGPEVPYCPVGGKAKHDGFHVEATLLLLTFGLHPAVMSGRPLKVLVFVQSILFQTAE
jgi:hypothetical protein